MKVVVILCALFSFALSFKFNIPAQTRLKYEAAILPHKAKCILESKVVADLGMNALLNMEFPEDDNFKCFLKCVGTSVGIFKDQEKKFDQQKSMEILGIPSTIYDKCFGEILDQNLCDVAFNTAKCVLRNIESVGIDIGLGIGLKLK
ncbi:hypothetical protein PPYR_13139 [Photinus pyralis]|uniref:Uncharacterized protein n=1 Tax=Photinus pyralis TaxID=7054 RepID=A0A5N4A898_PHOPY|nr:uncharacterized protein LOC116178780 [Photinus pyralis]KAB0793519.1 hypothetical protein PPYR_13139 [Photinus pyralis]